LIGTRDLAIRRTLATAHWKCLTKDNGSLSQLKAAKGRAQCSLTIRVISTQAQTSNTECADGTELGWGHAQRM